MLEKISYSILYAWAYMHAILPMRILYLFSDILYLFAYYLVGYRKKVVRENLKNSFPSKTNEERLQIEKGFYKHLCDYFFETIKLLHISDEEMKKRMIFHNTEIVEKIMNEDKSCFLYLGHYGNWEWVPSITLHMSKDIFMGQIYRPLTSAAFEKLFLKIRGRFGSVSIKKNETLRGIIKQRKINKKMMIGFIGDQTPSIQNIGYWTTFLGQDTPMLIGTEKISKMIDAAVVYLDIEKKGRGMYEGTFRMIASSPADTPEFYITEQYSKSMEKTILRDPRFWLWSHKRWKHKKTDIEAK